MSNIKLFESKQICSVWSLKSNRGTICTPVEMIATDGKKRKIQEFRKKSSFKQQLFARK